MNKNRAIARQRKFMRFKNAPAPSADTRHHSKTLLDPIALDVAEAPQAGFNYDGPMSPQTSEPFSVGQRSATHLRFPWPAKLITLALLAALAWGLWWHTSSVTQSLAAVFSALIIIVSLLRIAACLSPKRAEWIDAGHDPVRWPTYTVLVPLKDEAHMVDGLMTALSRLDYPHERLQILLITEQSDPGTTQAVKARLHPPFEIVIVPPGGPKTKPNALNVALTRSRGHIVTIYDAEDYPHPGQLKAAARALTAHPQWGAVQAPLDYFNTGDTLLTRQFGIEYAALFHVWIPFLARLGLPFPLGGTSNHMRRAALTRTQGWDAHNVTEDADLSFRLAAQGWTLGYITPPTDEEAIGDWDGWCDQRVRWMKGFLQSWLVHMGAPLAPGGWTGIKRQLTLQITLGFSLLSGLFHTLFMAAVLGAWIETTRTGKTMHIHPYWIATFVTAYGSGLLISIIGVIRAGKARLIPWVIMSPLYWLIIIIPTWISVIELWRAPFHWRKTTHGITATQSERI